MFRVDAFVVCGEQLAVRTHVCHCVGSTMAGGISAGAVAQPMAVMIVRAAAKCFSDVKGISSFEATPNARHCCLKCE